ELNISDNSIEMKESAFDTFFSISCLKLENCDLSYVGVNHLLHVLSSFKGPLKFLFIADNYLGKFHWEIFLVPTIEVLDIGGIGLGSYGFQELQNLIKEELKLVKINISKNRGGIETAKFLSKLLSQAPQLVEVNAASNLMPIESLAIVYSALKFAKGMLVSVLLGDHSAH
ncbi:hypothetical protein PHAVU_004G074200, partial [Phaseolus vulgaris]